ncbi:MAG: protein kinase [Candidatus Eisenbacteria sp.]|nr:protein kinase [Candidatus Eisenbacteria bacterium]
MKQVGDYEVEDKIGHGGMSTVYKGRQVSLDRPVAIKVLSEKLINCHDVLERFEREAHIIARLNHPNIIHVIDRGITSEGSPYFVMEYVEGTDLSEAIAHQQFDTNRKLDIVIQVCKALSHAHKNGVIHRDIKPANVLIDTDGNALVLDFGIARLFEEDDTQRHHTQPDLVMGTLAYMAPEQQTGIGAVTTASDIYSLGVVLYEFFTGVRPTGRFQLPSELDATISQDLEKIILRCLEPKPADRFSSVDGVKDGLLHLLQGAHLATVQKERARQGLAKVEDKFALLDVIRQSAYGSVLLYEDRIERNLLVIKKRIGTATGLSQSKVLTTLKHKNIVNIVGASGGDKLFIIVMEYLSGGSLKDRLIQPLPWGEALRIAQEMCAGLLFAHKNRIIHGNLRPSNILFTGSGQVKVTDFGLDEHYHADGGRGNWYNIWGERPTPQADMFAVGTILYEMLTGAVPVWEGFKIVPHDYFKLLPNELQQMVTRMISSEPDDRFDSLEQVISEITLLLQACKENPQLPGATEVMTIAEGGREPAGLHDRRKPKRRLWRVVLLLALLLVLSLAYLIYAGHFAKLSDSILALWGKLT